ncbi:MAG: DUF3604 domain-containing protein [Promethearchaeota archaeon]|nr:MAG: DUF3604 domain-containing protein [Candidatus Lokiarchaeota archaeon]
MEKNCYKLENLSVAPNNVNVRDFVNLSITFDLNFNLPKDSFLVFRIRGGRNNKNDWYCMQPYNPNANGYTVLSTNKSVKFMPLLITGKELLIKFLVCEENGILKSSTFHLKMYNTLVQSLVELKKKIEIIVELPGKKPIRLENSPSINVLNSSIFDHFTIICPSFVNLNEEFKVLIRVEDKYKNLIENFDESAQLYEVMSPNERKYLIKLEFNHKDQGMIIKKGLKISKTGIYNLEVSYKNQWFKSSPIICINNSPKKRLYWGYIHGHSLKSDGIRELNEYFENMIKAGLDFGTITEHDHNWETSDEDFEEIKHSIKEFHKNNEFVSFFGYEYGTWYSGYGDICIYHYTDNIPVFRSEINKYNSTKKLIKQLKQYEGNILMIAHHTALRPGFRNWKYFDNSLEKLVEIYSTWGNQEYSFSQGNPLPPRYKFFGCGKYARKRGAILEKKGSFVSNALEKGYKLGFVAGGDDHFGIYPSGSIDPDNGIYPPGIMAVWAEDNTKSSLWNALHNRKCYGTTGPRAIIKFYLDTYFMGDIIDLNDKPYLNSERTIKASIFSPLPIEKIELIRNNEVINIKVINQDHANYEYIDFDLFDKITLKHCQKKELFVFYYVRVFISNNNMAWSSPIWLTKNLEETSSDLNKNAN